MSIINLLGITRMSDDLRYRFNYIIRSLRKIMFISFKLFDVYFQFRFQWKKGKKSKKSKIKFVSSKSKSITNKDDGFLGSIKTKEFIKANIFVIPNPVITLVEFRSYMRYKMRAEKIIQAC